jgi:hypothetical protein
MSKIKKPETSKSKMANKLASTLGGKFSQVIHHKSFAQSFSFLIFIIMIIKSYSYHKIGDYGGKTDSYQSYVPQEILRLRDWYFKNVPDSERGQKIAARKRQVAFYLQYEILFYSMADNLVQLLDYLKKNNDDYLFFIWVEVGTHSKLRYLLNSGPEVPGLERIVSFKEPPAVLYRVRKSGK